MPFDYKARTEINELTDTLKSNFDKGIMADARMPSSRICCSTRAKAQVSIG